MLGVLESTHKEEGRRSLAFEEQMHLFPLIHLPADKSQSAPSHSTVMILKQPRALKIRVLIRVFGYPPDDCAACNLALDRYRIPLQASISS